MKEIVTEKLREIWDEPEFYNNIFYIVNEEKDIKALNEYLDSNEGLTSDDVFKKVFEICRLDIWK